MTKIIKHSKGVVTISKSNLNTSDRTVSVEGLSDSYIPIKSCETNYSDELIQLILDVKGVEYLCDEICRDTDPTYVQRDLRHDLTSYFPNEDFANKRIMDFGCGSGASTMILSRMYPKAQIIGVELEDHHLKIARARLQHYKCKNIEFHQSPSGNELPAGIGEFDLVIMSAVYEHLLPDERENTLPLIWHSIKPNGCLFLNMTPHRWFPIEHHTTNLPLLNYLPANLALSYARIFSNRIDKKEPWEILLRRGIRGGTEFEILDILNKPEKSAILLNPKLQKDRIDLWFSQLNQGRHLLVKKGIRLFMKLIKLLTGQTLTPNLSLVIQKQGS